MSKLSSKQSEELNEILDGFYKLPANKGQETKIKMGGVIVYQGVPGTSPKIKNLTSQQLENLKKAINDPKNSKGVVQITRGSDTYRVEQGNLSQNSFERTKEFAQLRTSIAERSNEFEVLLQITRQQQAEISELRQHLKEQADRLQKVSTPIQKRLRNWFIQVRERVSDRVHDFRGHLSERLEAVRAAAKRQIQNAAVKAVSEIVRAAGDRQSDGSVVLQAGQQKIQATPSPKREGEGLTLQERAAYFAEKYNTGIEVSAHVKTQQQTHEPKQPQSQRIENLTEQSKPEAQQQQESAQDPFTEYARHQQQSELAKLNQPEKGEFDHLVSEKEQQLLIEFRTKKLKEEYESRQLEEVNAIPLHDFESKESSSLIQEYLDFKKKEKSGNEANKKISANPDFKVQQFSQRAPDDMQISMGIVPPRNITPAGATQYSQLMADSKTRQAERIIEQQEKRLRSDGIEIDPRQSEAIRKKAYDKVGREWEEETAQKLKSWSESLASESFQSFTNFKDFQVEDVVSVAERSLDSLNESKLSSGSGYHFEKNGDTIIVSGPDRRELIRAVGHGNERQITYSPQFQAHAQKLKLVGWQGSKILEDYSEKYAKEESNQAKTQTDKQATGQQEGEGLSLQERLAYFQEKNGVQEQQTQNKQREKSR